MTKHVILAFIAIASITGTALADVASTRADKQIVKITPAGFSPKNITVSKGDASIFFYNDTGSAIDTFAIHFGKKRIHCHNPSLVLDTDGYLRNTQPIIPHSFVIACFPDAATYKIEVGLATKSLHGTVVVPESKKSTN